MKNLLLIILIGLLSLGTVYASDNGIETKSQVFLETKIYRLTGADQSARVLESSPAIVALAGEQASITIGVGDDNNDNSQIAMYFIPDASASTYDVKLELLDGDNTVISHIEDTAMDKPMNFSAKLNDVTRVFSLNATVLNNQVATAETASGTSTMVVNDESCGRVSTFRRPPSNQRFFTTAITRVNDNNVDIEKKTHRLAPGKQTIKVSAPGSTRRAQRGKEFELVIEPNMTYYIGAKFVEEKRYRTRNEENWTPVVWRVIGEACSF